MEAVNKYPKLMILGKPGSGKTTFLKHLALQCIEGDFQADCIPLFITLKEFAETPDKPSLLEYLIKLFVALGISSNIKVKTGLLKYLLNWKDPNINQVLDLTPMEQLLEKGKLLILLDGLDEVKEVDNKRVLEQIRDFITEFNSNRFVITCRIAAQEYTLEQFTEVEIADFEEEQINNFASKWFKSKNDIVKSKHFINKLEENKSIKELATSPLLLTLLCLVFEELGNFPLNRSELYKEGLDVLLKKWDAKRNIERDQVYRNLSLKRKEDLLSQIALETFKKGDYFFKQKKIEGHITQYIRNLPDASYDTKVLQLDSEAILKSIESQHGLLIERARGIYSFSHLTFHEYFVARKIVTGSNPYLVDDKLLQSLAIHINKKHWREVYLLTVEMLDNADTLLQLMKTQIDKLLEIDSKLQEFLTWVEQKSRSVELSYKKNAAVRAFYFARTLDSNPNSVCTFILALAQDLDSAFNRALNHALIRARDKVSDAAFAQALSRAINTTYEFDFPLARALSFCLPLSRDNSLDRTLEVGDNALELQNPARYFARDLATNLINILDITLDNALKNALSSLRLGNFDEVLDNALNSILARDFYYALDSAIDRILDKALDNPLDRERDSTLDSFLDSTLSLCLCVDKNFDNTFSLSLIFALSLCLNRSLDLALESPFEVELQKSLKQLRKQLPDISNENLENMKE